LGNLNQLAQIRLKALSKTSYMTLREFPGESDIGPETVELRRAGRGAGCQKVLTRRGVISERQDRWVHEGERDPVSRG